MPILTYLKLGTIAAVIILAGYFYFDYQHLKTQNTAYKIQVEELVKATKFYEKSAGIDRKTQEVHDEIQKAVNSGDIQRIRDLYKQLREHHRSGTSNAAPKTDDGDND